MRGAQERSPKLVVFARSPISYSLWLWQAKKISGYQESQKPQVTEESQEKVNPKRKIDFLPQNDSYNFFFSEIINYKCYHQITFI